jgi:hypothetical protein
VTAFSHSNYPSYTTTVPTCDAWLNFQMDGASVTPGLSSGVSSVSRLSAGNFRINFASPSNFGAGAYVTLLTPELKHDAAYCQLSALAGGATATGFTSSTDMISWIYPNYATPVLRGNTANVGDPSSGIVRANAAVFCLSSDTTLRTPAGATYSLFPGERGYGISTVQGRTYGSAMMNTNSNRRASAYGTVVIPPITSNASPVACYLEDSFNIKGVSCGSNAVFDVAFLSPMSSKEYSVILSYETEELEDANAYANLQEYSMLLVRRGASDQHKTVNGFRFEVLKQNPTNNGWTLQSFVYQSGKTQRVHFMVFGGATFGSQ